MALPSRNPGIPGVRALGIATGLLSISILACRGGGGGSADPAPAIQEVNPAQAYALDEVNIYGQHFTGATRVLVAGHQARRFQVVSDRHLRVQVPRAEGVGAITVETARGTSAAGGAFQILPAPQVPRIDAFAPAQGAPGTLVTLQGSGFLPVRGVTFRGIPATFTVVSDTVITATVPAGFQTGTLSLRLPAEVTATASGSFRVTAPPPVLYGFQPVSGPPGTRVFVLGDALEHVQAVSLGGRPVPAFTVSGSALTFEVPPEAVSGPVALTGAEGVSVSSAPSVFTVEIPAPAASGFEPASGQVGTWVTVAGSHLAQITGATVGGVAVEVMEPAAAEGSTLRLRVPPGAFTGPLVLQSAAGAILVPGGPFTVLSPALRADSFTPAQGLPGTEVTVLGEYLDQVELVDFGGAVAPPSAIAADRLTVMVPEGSATAPLRLLTAGGDIQVPGGAFTVLSPAPVLTAFQPAGGPPGTEVTLDGQHLGTFTEVRYGTLVVPADRIERRAGGLRFRVPDDANLPAVIAVATPGGDTQTAAPFQLAPSRITALNQPLARRDLDFAGWRLDFPQERRTAQYDLGLPLAPVLHPYNPGENGAMREDHFFPAYPVSLLLPAAFYPALPRALRDRVAALGLDPARVDILVAGQDCPYPGTLGANGAPDPDRTYLYRPHYWTDPEAPYQGVYVREHRLQAAFFEAEGDLLVSGHPAGTLFPFTITTHGPGATQAGTILSSGFSEPVTGLDPTRTTAFWSLVVLGDRAAATLHLLLADAHLALFNQAAPGLATLGDLFAATPDLAATRAFQMLRALGRPLVEGAAAEDTPAGRILHLNGTGLAGATSVRLGDASLPFAALSDARIRVTLPGGAAGEVTVTTPLGTSDPVPLP